MKTATVWIMDGAFALFLSPPRDTTIVVRDGCIVIIMAQSIPSVPTIPKSICQVLKPSLALQLWARARQDRTHTHIKAKESKEKTKQSKKVNVKKKTQQLTEAIWWLNKRLDKLKQPNVNLKISSRNTIQQVTLATVNLSTLTAWIRCKQQQRQQKFFKAFPWYFQKTTNARTWTFFATKQANKR